jgi:hypothetical protein
VGVCAQNSDILDISKNQAETLAPRELKSYFCRCPLSVVEEINNKAKLLKLN